MCSKTLNKAYLQSAVYWNSLSTTKAHKLLMMMVVNDSFIVTCEQPSCPLRNTPRLRTNFGRAELRPPTNFDLARTSPAQLPAWSCAALISWRCTKVHLLFTLSLLSPTLLPSTNTHHHTIKHRYATPWNIYTS